MAGYTPLFDSLTTGTLYGRWPDIGLWAVILSLPDKRGIVDVTPEYLAGVTGLPVDDVIACMDRFCRPDPRSRSGAEAGARLVLIDASRSWGWRIVNHGLYRERARKMAYDADRTASGKDAERKRLSRDVPTRPATSRDVPLSDADAKQEEKERAPRSRASRLPDDFEPDAEYAIATLPDLDVAAESARFSDYWRGKSGSGGMKVDWQATWRNWIRNCKDSGRYAKRAERKFVC